MIVGGEVGSEKGLCRAFSKENGSLARSFSSKISDKISGGRTVTRIHCLIIRKAKRCFFD